MLSTVFAQTCSTQTAATTSTLHPPAEVMGRPAALALLLHLLLLCY